jgi:methyl-accepting chemotaxis protein
VSEPARRTLAGWLRRALVVLIVGPLAAVAGLGYLALSELHQLQTRREHLRTALAEAHNLSTEVVKASHLDRTLAIASEVELLLRGHSGPIVDQPELVDVLRRARVGRAGGVVVIGADDHLAWDLDDENLGRPAREVYPALGALLDGARWRKAPSLAGAGFILDNGLAETALDGDEFWVLSPTGRGYALATHGELDGRNAAALAKAQAMLDGVLDDLTASDQRVVRRLSLALGAVLLLGAALMALTVARFRRRIVAPIRDLTDVAVRIGEGELERRAQIATGDELETLGRSINAMVDRLSKLIAGEEQKQALERNIMRLLEAVSRASDGDLTSRGEVTPDELGSVVDAFNHMLESIGRLVGEVRHAGDQVTRAADAILSASERTSAGAELQSTELDRVSRTIKALGQRALEINRIVELVDDIAAQTNLLALNAAIETSRAPADVGGKGFALVADEVRKLAERSGAATKDIGEFIESIQEATDDAVRAMDEIREVTQANAEEAREQTQVAQAMVASARALASAIARFKVRAPPDPVETARILERLKARRAELERALAAVVEGQPSREAAEEVLRSLDHATAAAHAARPRP